MQQDMRSAIVKVPGQSAVRITTPEVYPYYARAKRVASFVAETMERCDFTAPPDVIAEEIDKREVKLITDLKQSVEIEDEEDVLLVLCCAAAIHLSA